MDFETALFRLEKDAFFVWDDFLSQEETKSVMLDYRKLQNDGQFKRAGIGQGPERQVNDQIRKDEISWLDPDNLSVSQALFWNRLDELKEKINAHFFLGLWALEGHYSHDTRTISMVLYLNPEWDFESGGELRLHTPNPRHPEVDLLPLGGRLVCFMSAELPHEVLSSQKERFSFAGWWKRRS